MTEEISTGRLAAFADLTESELTAFRGLAEQETLVPAGHSIRGAWPIGPSLQFLHHGWAASSIALPNGGTQIVKLYLPGDIMGAPSLPFEQPGDTLLALTSVKVSMIRLEHLTNLFTRFPRIAALLFLAAQEERALLMDRLVTLGRLNARERVAALLTHIHDRLQGSEPGRGVALQIPLTQRQIGDVVGLTAVHVNRILQQLETEGEITRRGKLFRINDIERLRDLAALPFRTIRRDPGWLPAAHTA